MMAALALSLAAIPLWAFSHELALLTVGAFVMQIGVQGAWGVIPVHLNELAADSARGLMPGLAYQLGILFASPTNSVQYALRVHVGYQWAIAGFEIVTICALVLLLWFGAEEHGKVFVSGESA
jgi:MFS transporter, SHS family, lactate transporter